MSTAIDSPSQSACDYEATILPASEPFDSRKGLDDASRPRKLCDGLEVEHSRGHTAGVEDRRSHPGAEGWSCVDCLGNRCGQAFGFPSGKRCAKYCLWAAEVL